jgi:hypothetical protein
MKDEKSKYDSRLEQLIKQHNSGWERLFPDNPELENVFM